MLDQDIDIIKYLKTIFFSVLISGPIIFVIIELISTIVKNPHSTFMNILVSFFGSLIIAYYNVVTKKEKGLLKPDRENEKE